MAILTVQFIGFNYIYSVMQSASLFPKFVITSNKNYRALTLLFLCLPPFVKLESTYFFVPMNLPNLGIFYK